MRVLLVLLSLFLCQCFRYPVRLTVDRQHVSRTRALSPADHSTHRIFLDPLSLPRNLSSINNSVVPTDTSIANEVGESNRSISIFTKLQEFLRPISNAATFGLRNLYNSKRQVAEEVPVSLTKKIIDEYSQIQQALHDHEFSEVHSDESESSHLSLGQRLGQLVGWHRDSEHDAAQSPSVAALQDQLNKLGTNAALAINSTADARAFAGAIGFDVLIDQLQLASSSKLDILQSLENAVKHLPEYGVDLVQSRLLLDALCEWMEAPLKSLFVFRPKAEQLAAYELQREAVQFLQRLVRNNGITVDLLKTNGRLIGVLNQLAVSVDSAAVPQPIDITGRSGAGVSSLLQRGTLSPTVKRRLSPPLLIGRTVISDYCNLTTSQMARVTAWGIGGVPWRPRQPNQKGLRILTFDGGGTKGVLSAAMLTELWAQLGYDQEHTKPCDVFDIICGTSTGGILAALYGLQQKGLTATEELYESFVDKIFAGRSSLNLLSSKAYYREEDFENILHEFCGEQLLVDSNQQPQVPRVFCVSTKVNDGSDAGKAHLWRNYNYPPGVQPKYSGSCFANTYTAIRATTAAPTFFTPVTWKDGVYIDGAMVANNPTAIAVQEAKVLYPGVPIELVVSIGTGRFSDRDTSSLTISWSRLLSQIVASSTDTEDVHTMLTHFLPSSSYYRFNPSLKKHYTIDEKNKATLQELKQVGRDYIANIAKSHGGSIGIGGMDSERFQRLVNLLHSNNNRH